MKLLYKAGTVLAFTFFLLICFPAHAQAAVPQLSLSGNVENSKAGGEVDAVVSMQGNTGITSASFVVSYDNKLLKYVSSSWSTSISANDAVQASDQGSSVLLSISSTEGYTANGNIVTLHFQVLEDISNISFDLQVNELTEVESASAEEVPELTMEESNEDTGWIDDDEDTDFVDEIYDEDISDSEDAWETDNEEDAEAAKIEKKAVNKVSNSEKSDVTKSYTANTGKKNQEKKAEKKEAKLDDTYKTGAGFGNDIFLLISTISGLLALTLLARRQK